jgi:hypothetical protein
MALSRDELEECWRKRVQDARGRYLRTKQESVQAAKERAEGLTPSPYGSLAVRQALRAERSALAEYVRTLKAFSDLVMNRKIPFESSEPAAPAA